MSLPSVGQAKMLADRFQMLIERKSPSSVAVIGTVSPSAYTSLQALAPLMKLIAPTDLSRYAVAAGFTTEESSTFALPSGKQFCLQTFRLR